MPEIRLSDLPHEQQYILDNAVDYGGLSAAAHTALTLYGDPARIEAAIDADLKGHFNQTRRQMQLLRLERYAGELVADLPPKRRYAFLVIGAYRLALQCDETADYLAESNFEDQTKGGCCLPFRKFWRLTRNEDPTPRTARRLYSPAAIRRHVKQSEDARHLRSVFETLASSCRIPDVAFGDYQEEARAIEQDFQTQRQAVLRRMEAARARIADTSDRRTLRARPEVRRRVKRSAAIAAAVVGAQSVSAFARGEPVVVRGDTVAFSIGRRGSIHDPGGHGSLNLAIDSLEGERLGRLCLYQDNTPPLDQLATIALHVAAGEEAAVLDAGNLFSIEPAGLIHPALTGRIKASEERAEAIRHRDPYARFREKVVAYRARTQHIYRSAMRQAVFGRGAGLLPELGEYREAA